MQYGNLTEVQAESFSSAQSYSVRKPSFIVWIEGLDDPTGNVMEIDTEVSLEFPRGRGFLNIGRAILTMNNSGGLFYSDGRSRIDRNAKIGVWAGMDGLNIPIFTGIIHSVEPVGTTDLVFLNCKDYMGLFQNVLIQGSQDPNNTARLLMESFCSIVNIPAPAIASTEETTGVYSHPIFDEVSLLEALEEICKSILYIAYFDENGNLCAVEREYSAPVDYRFCDDNVIDCENLADTEIINDITVDYSVDFFTKYEDNISIDTYGRHSRSDYISILNSTIVSERTSGSTTKELNYSLEALKFESSGDSTSIDCLHIRMKQNEAHGYISAGIYTDDGGVPDALIAESQLKACNDLATEFAWEIFYFTDPIKILPATSYWVVIDTGSLNSGAVYIQIDGTGGTAQHAYYDSGNWITENNVQALHRIRGSINAQRVAEDTVRFYRDPHERIRITAPGLPQLQLLDEVMVDIKLREKHGYYVVEGRRHIITPEDYTTVDTLRKK